MFKNKFRDNTFSFTGHFKIFGVISILLCIVGIIGLVALPFGVKMFNFDIDFLGGTTMQFELHEEVTADVSADIREITEGIIGQPVSSVTKAGDSGTQVVIKTLEIDSETRDAVFEAVKAAYNLPAEDQPIKSDYVSASVGADLRKSAIIASLLAAVLILVYITIRFEFKSGLAAVIALIHDLLVLCSMYIIFRIPFNMNFIAAALTILGYSINATIVVFDRVRENRKLTLRAPFGQIVDKSIWQTFSRSLNTTITTALVLIVLLILGVSSIRNFALPLLIGVICGCYSSVCISGPLWNIFKGGNKKNKKKAA